MTLFEACVSKTPLDDLVGAPEVGDPRIHLKPQARNGRVVVPLTRQPGALQAWKVVVPPDRKKPELRTHEGYEWLYVLVDDDWALLGNKAGATRLGFGVLLKYFELEARFPRHVGEVPRPAVDYVAQQVKVPAEQFAGYDFPVG